MLMNIGPRKGAFISKLLGGAQALSDDRMRRIWRLFSHLVWRCRSFNWRETVHELEINPENAAVANMLVELAGLREFVRIIVRSSNDSLTQLIQVEKDMFQIELLFIDHWKDLYPPGLLLLEESSILKPSQSVLAADNVIMPGLPKYLELARASPAPKIEMAEKKKFAFSKEGFERVLTKDAAVDRRHVIGNPNLVYELSIDFLKWGQDIER